MVIPGNPFQEIRLEVRRERFWKLYFAKVDQRCEECAIVLWNLISNQSIPYPPPSALEVVDAEKSDL